MHHRGVAVCFCVLANKIGREVSCHQYFQIGTPIMYRSLFLSMDMYHISQDALTEAKIQLKDSHT